MYVPSAFDADVGRALALIRAFPFAVLLSFRSQPPAAPCVTHLPLLWRDDGSDFGVLEGHLARANPHAALICAGAPSLAIFNGPHAYVSPAWYEAPDVAVPTWNYAVVHAHGRPLAVDNTADTLAALAAITRHFEAAIGGSWARETDDALIRLAGSIVVFHLPIERLQPKFKLSQNRSDADRGQVAAQLAASPDTQSQLTAQWMRD